MRLAGRLVPPAPRPPPTPTRLPTTMTTHHDNTPNHNHAHTSRRYTRRHPPRRPCLLPTASTLHSYAHPAPHLRHGRLPSPTPREQLAFTGPRHATATAPAPWPPPNTSHRSPSLRFHSSLLSPAPAPKPPPHLPSFRHTTRHATPTPPASFSRHNYARRPHPTCAMAASDSLAVASVSPACTRTRSSTSATYLEMAAWCAWRSRSSADCGKTRFPHPYTHVSVAHTHRAERCTEVSMPAARGQQLTNPQHRSCRTPVPASAPSTSTSLPWHPPSVAASGHDAQPSTNARAARHSTHHSIPPTAPTCSSCTCPRSACRAARSSACAEVSHAMAFSVFTVSWRACGTMSSLS